MASEFELLWHDRDDTIGDTGRPVDQVYLGKTSPSLNAETPRYLQALSAVRPLVEGLDIMGEYYSVL